MAENDVYLSSLPPTPSFNDNDKILAIVNGSEYLITKDSLVKSIGSLSSDDREKINSLIINGNGTRILTDKGEYVQLSLFEGYHSHTNKDTVLDKLAVNENNELTFNGEAIANEEYTLPVATQTILGGVKIDGDTIKINNGVISADVIGNWSAGNSYPVGYFVVYKQKLYECTVANSDSIWDENHWLLIAGNIESGTVINDWAANTEYVVGDLAIKDNTLIRCIEAHTSTVEIDMTKWVFLTGAKGDKGEPGADGVSPTVVTTQKEDSSGNTVTITDINGTNSFDVMNGADGINGESAYEIACKNGFVGSEAEWLNSLKGTDGITTVTTNKVDKTCTFLATDWGDILPYTQTVAVEGITETLNPRIDVIISDNMETGKKEETAFSCLTKVITGDGVLTAYCYNTKPDVDLNIMIEVI